MTHHTNYKKLRFFKEAAHRNSDCVELVDRLQWARPPTASAYRDAGSAGTEGANASGHDGHGYTVDLDSAIAEAQTRRRVATQIGSRVLGFLFIVALGLLALIARVSRRPIPAGPGVLPAGDLKEGRAMSGPVVVIHLVRCWQSLLDCNDIPTGHLRFADPPECEAAIPALIAVHANRDRDQPIVMGRCRIIIASQVPPRKAKPLN